MVEIALPAPKPATSRSYLRWFESLLEASWLYAGRHLGKVVAERLAESHYEKGERISAVAVLANAAARFSNGRFPPTALGLLQKIVDEDFSASSLRTVAHTCVQHGESKHLVAAVHLLGMAYEHDRTDTQSLELLACAFRKMGLEEKARKVEAILNEIAEEEPTQPGWQSSPGPAQVLPGYGKRL